MKARKYFLLALSFVFIILLLYIVYYIREKKVNFLQSESEYYIQDNLAGHIHRANTRREIEWEEYEKKKIIIQTNNLGFMEDKDTEIKKPENSRRILITGDSHTDGVVNNEESFANLLENKLNESSTQKNFEVINGGTGYYTFQNYTGFLKKYLYLQPEVFMVSIYTGNDFLEAIKEDTKNSQLSWQLKRLWNRIKMRLVFKDGGITQAINQVMYFAAFPEMKKEAIAIAEKYLSEIQLLCQQKNITLIVVFLPSKFDVEKSMYYADLKKKTNLSEKELAVNQELLHELSDWLNAININQADITPFMNNQPTKYFWEADHHLNTEGHRLVATILFDKYKSLLKK